MALNPPLWDSGNVPETAIFADVLLKAGLPGPAAAAKNCNKKSLTMTRTVHQTAAALEKDNMFKPINRMTTTHLNAAKRNQHL
jgi:hypothetical protein